MKLTKSSQHAKASGSATDTTTSTDNKKSLTTNTPKPKATTKSMFQLGPPSTASIEAAAKAASKEQPDPEVRGDPRMNRAVQAKLKNPQLSLSDALRVGGFEYPPRATASAVDAENVTLGQRKNQLNRRLRQARLNHAAMLERGIANGTISVNDAASVCGSVVSTSSANGIKRGSAFMSSLPGSEAQKRQAIGNYQTTLNALGVQQNHVDVLNNHHQPQAQHHQDLFKNGTNGSAVMGGSNPALLGQQPQLLDQLLQMQSLQQHQQSHNQQSNHNSNGLMQQQQQYDPIPANTHKTPHGIILQAQQLPQQQQPLQLVATNNSQNGNTPNLNTQYMLVPVAPQDSQSVASGSVVHIQPVQTSYAGNNNNNMNSNASVTDNNSYAAVTVSTKASSHHNGSHNGGSPLTDDHEDDDDDDDEDDGIEDERLKAGLQIFGREIRALYQSAMLRAGFSPEEVHESNQTYHSFAFHAWRKECQTLQKLIRSDDDDGMSQAQQNPNMSSGRSVASHHSNVQQQQQQPMSSNRSVASYQSHHSNPHHHMSGGRSVTSHHQVSVHNGNAGGNRVAI